MPSINPHRILLSIALFVLLGSSIALNFLLYGQARKYYLEVNETRLDPLGLDYYPVLPAAEREAGLLRVVFFGDSRAEGWVAPAIQGTQFINRGISSQTSTQALQRFSQHVRPLAPDVVVIQVGVNDLKTVALFPDRREAIVARCQANIQALVAASKSLGAIVIVTTIFPTGRVPLERRPFWSDEIERAIQDVNAYITTLADDQTLVFDSFPLLADRQGRLLRQYGDDELHLNEQGYALLNQELGALITRIQQNKQSCRLKHISDGLLPPECQP